MKSDRRESLIMTIIILVLVLVLGYAYLTTDLNIQGLTDVLESSWDIHWENVVVSDGSVSGSQVTQAPTITNNQTTVSYHIRLKEPGEYYEFTVDAVNAGTMDGMVSVVSSTLNGNPISSLPPYLDYSVTYYDGISIAQNQILPASSREKYKVRVEYKQDITVNQLPTSAQSLSLTFSVNYVQADGNGTDIREYIYYNGYEASSPAIYPTIGQRFPSRIQVFYTPQEALDAANNDLFLMSRIASHIITENYIGIDKKGTIYYLQSGGATFIGTGQGYGNQGYDDDSPYYETNKAVLDEMFGPNICSEWIGDGQRYNCTDSHYHIIAYANGSINVQSFDTGADCRAGMNGSICCGCSAKGGKGILDDPDTKS